MGWACGVGWACGARFVRGYVRRDGVWQTWAATRRYGVDRAMLYEVWERPSRYHDLYVGVLVGACASADMDEARHACGERVRDLA